MNNIPSAINQGLVNNCVAQAVTYCYNHKWGTVFDPNWLHGRRIRISTTLYNALTVCEDEGNVPVLGISIAPDMNIVAEKWVDENLPQLLKEAEPYKCAGFAQINTENELVEAINANKYVVFSISVTTRLVGSDGVYRPYSGTNWGYAHALSAWGIENGLIRVLNSWGEEWGDKGQALMTPADVLKGNDCWCFWFRNNGGGNMHENKWITGVSEGKAAVLRAEPDTNSEQVGEVRNGDSVIMLAEEGDRALVSLGSCGWVLKKYLTDKPPDIDTPDLGDEPEDENSKIQWYLHKWGFGDLVGKIDGIIGTKTKTAIKHFQAAMGLSADGIVGKNTWAALKSEVIVPRLDELDMECTCGKLYCNGRPNPCTTGVRILIERIWREAEKKYPGVQLFITNLFTPAPDGAVAGGQRCPEWNKLRGGASKSQHLYGTAADIYGKADGVADSTIRQHLEDIALDMNTYGGVGYGARYIVHVDIRGYKARWEY